MDIECCGVHYVVSSSESKCVFCDRILKPKKVKPTEKKKRLSGAQRQQLRKSGLIKPRGEEEEYLRYLLEESEKFRLRQLKGKHYNVLLVCPLCKQVKPLGTFNWLRGRKPEYDILSPEYREDLVLAYGEVIRDKTIVCGQCVANYTNNNLPRTEAEQWRIDKRIKLNYYKQNRRLINVPEGGLCPKCSLKRSLHPNAWTRAAGGVVCRVCAKRSKSIHR